MNKLKSSADRKAILADYGIGLCEAQAVFIKESDNQGFHPSTGALKIRFEAHLFKAATGHLIETGEGTQAEMWKAYMEAYKIDKEQAMFCTSFGIAQILGSNFKNCGYKSVQQMVAEFSLSEYFQIKGFGRFITTESDKTKTLKAHEWADFARLYNGLKYAKNKYDIDIQANYERCSDNLKK